MPVNHDAIGIQIDIAPLDRRGLGLSQSCKPQEFYEFAALFRVRVETLGANISHDPLELLKVGVCRIGCLRFLYFSSLAGLSRMTRSATAKSNAARIRVNAEL